MTSIEYQRYLIKQLLDRLAPSTWANAFLAILVLCVTLATSAFTTTHIVFYTFFILIFVFRIHLQRRTAHKQYLIASPDELKKDNNHFTFLIASTGLFWAFIITLPAILDTHSAFWNQFDYFLATGLLASALFNIGISKRNFLAFCIPVVLGLGTSSILTQETLITQILFVFIIVLFFLFMTTLQKKTEDMHAQIYQRQQDMILILEGFPGAISLVENGHYLYMNSKLISLLIELIPIKTNDAVGTHNLNQELVRKIKEFEGGQLTEQEFEIELLTAAGHKMFWVILKRLHENKIMILSLDIDEKRTNEKKIAEQNIRLIESSKMASLGEMSSGIAHEINNPLTIIQGSTRQLNRLASTLTDDMRIEVEKITYKIDSMSSRITKIIKGLRSFAREGSQDPFDYVSAKQIIDETLFICESRFQNSQIEIRKNYQIDSHILCRSVQISQVILNLLNNAFDSILEKRSATIPTLTTPSAQNPTSLEERNDFIDITTQMWGDQFIIRISDTGAGIPETIQTKIMNPFFTTKAVGKGTGLGLSISRSIMDDHYGDLIFNFDSPQTEVNLVFKKIKPPHGSKF